MSANIDPLVIEELLTRGVEETINKKSLEEKLKSGKKLRVKLGVDVTAPDLHLGHTVPLFKLKQFQDAGHQIIFLIGDATTQIGDPSGKNKTRPVLTKKEIDKNAKTYLDQVSKILDLNKTEVRYNSEWFDKMGFSDLVRLSTHFSVARILERDDFTKRLKSKSDIRLHELFYSIMQGYDSYELKADIEIGGTDQKFNLLAGRTMQKRLDQKQQDVITLPLVVGTDGKEKMGKSTGNYIGITESPKDQFGKIMSIPDETILSYFELLTDTPQEEIDGFRDSLNKNSMNPRDIKARLAKRIVTRFHGGKEALKAEKEFNQVFRDKEKPTNIPEIKIVDNPVLLVDLIVKNKLASSKSEAKRLMEQGGVKLDDKKIIDHEKKIKVKKGQILQVGKRKFVKIKL
ncbi:tyrosine--tRNA ligase [Patescibacteria group bacterium]